MAHSVKTSASMPNDWTLIPVIHIEGEHRLSTCTEQGIGIPGAGVTWVLGTELRSSERAVCALNC